MFLGQGAEFHSESLYSIPVYPLPSVCLRKEERESQGQTVRALVDKEEPSVQEFCYCDSLTCVNPRTAHLDAEYAETSDMALKAAALEAAMILPPLR